MAGEIPLNSPFTMDEMQDTNGFLDRHLDQPYDIGDLFPGIPGIPVYPPITPYHQGEVTGIADILANRFPTPPQAVGFLTDPFFELDVSILVEGIVGNPISGALTAEGKYLEPTIGQIWPR